jgi:hypothetical protein
VVNSAGKVHGMKTTSGNARKTKGSSVATVRASISFPPEVYEILEGIAKENKVSLAWVVREAAAQYINGKWPLFGGKAR